MTGMWKDETWAAWWWQAKGEATEHVFTTRREPEAAQTAAKGGHA